MVVYWAAASVPATESAGVAPAASWATTAFVVVSHTW